MSNATKQMFGMITGILAAVFCNSGGIYLLVNSTGGTDTLSVGLGLYFIGKGIFVGALLIISSQPPTMRRQDAEHDS